MVSTVQQDGPCKKLHSATEGKVIADEQIGLWSAWWHSARMRNVDVSSTEVMLGKLGVRKK